MRSGYREAVERAEQLEVNYTTVYFQSLLQLSLLTIFDLLANTCLKYFILYKDVSRRSLSKNL